MRREADGRRGPHDRPVRDEEIDQGVREAGGARRAGTARRVAAGLPDQAERRTLLQRVRPVERGEQLGDGRADGIQDAG